MEPADVIQLRKKKHKTTKTEEENEDDFELNITDSELMKMLKVTEIQISQLFIDEEDDKCCPEEERSSQASDYFRKPSNVDISPPPECSETVLIRQQEFLKHFENIQLSEDQANCLTIVMQDALYELLILNNCGRALLEQMKDEANKEIESKGSPRKNDDGTIDDTQLNSEALKLSKMDGDKHYLAETMAKIYMDLKTNKSFPTVLVHLSDLSTKSYKAVAREIHYKELKSTLRKLQAKLAKDREGHKEKLLQLDREIYGLIDDIDDSTWNSDIRMRYVDAWQNAQQEQHALAIEKVEWGPLGTIKGCKELTVKENRIHKEIVKFFKTSTEEYLNDIELWMEKFDREIDQLDMDIRVLKEARAMQQDEIDALQLLKDEHKREMDEWQAVLDERERIKLLTAKQLTGAIKIQSWWRGCLARKLAAKMRKRKNRKKGKKK